MAVTTEDFFLMLTKTHGHTDEDARTLLAKYADAHAQAPRLTYWDMGEMLRAEGHDCEKAGCSHGDEA